MADGVEKLRATLHDAGAALHAEVGALLAALQVPDNVQRKAAEERLKVLSKDARIVPALLQFLTAASDAAVRQLAGVLVRKRITVHWIKQAPELQVSIKHVLLERIVGEPESPVRRASADVVGVLAKMELPNNQWPSLLAFLHKCSQSANPEHREVALVIFCSLAENVGQQMEVHFDTLHSIFLAGLQDAHPRVRMAALRAVGALQDLFLAADDATTTQRMSKIRDLVPPMIALCSASVHSTDPQEELVMKTFEILFEMSGLPSKVMQPVLAPLVQFSMEIAYNKALEVNTRELGMEMAGTLATTKAKQLIKLKLMQPLVEALCMLCAEPCDEELDEDFQTPVYQFAAQTLDTLANHVPGNHIASPTLHFCGAAVTHAEWTQRRGALAVLTAVAEGCGEVLRKQLPAVLPSVVALLADPHEKVRTMATMAVSEFAIRLQPNILEHHKLVLTGLFGALKDPNNTVQERAMVALETFCEDLGEEVVPYMAPLMEVIIGVIKSNAKVEVLEPALSAACSIAGSAGAAFAPYLPELVPVLQSCMTQTAAEHMQIRAHATECLGLLLAVKGGKEAMGAHVPAFMQTALQGFSFNNNEVREYSHGFFANTAMALQADFAVYLPHVVPLALASLALDDGPLLDGLIEDDDDDDEDGLGSGGGGGVVAGVRAALGDNNNHDDDEEEEEEEQKRKEKIHTAIMDEKMSACHALGSFMQATKGAFAPYIEQVMQPLLKMAKYFHEDVRNKAMYALAQLVTAAHAVSPLDAAGTAPSNLQLVIDAVMRTFLEAVDSDDDHDAVSTALCGSAEVLNVVGGVPLAAYMEQLLKACTEVIQEETMCLQYMLSDSEGESDDEETEEGTSGKSAMMLEVLLEGVVELLPALCKVGGAEFAPHFDRLVGELVQRHGRRSCTDQQRKLVSAIVSDGFKALGSLAGPTAPRLFAFLKSEMGADGHSSNRRNAVFTAGVVCEFGAAHAAPFYPTLVPVVMQCLGADAREDPGVKDNAAGAVARLLVANAGPLPVAELLQLLLNALPLKEDQEEAEPCYMGLCKLLARRDANAFPFAGSIVKAFATALVFDCTGGDDCTACIRATLQQLAAEGFQQHLEGIVAGLPEDEKTALTTLLA